MMKSFVNVALCQRSGAGTKESNLKSTAQMIDSAVAGCADLDVIVFPEYNNFVPNSPEDSLREAETIPGPYIEAIAELAKKHHVNIIPGSMLETVGGGKTRNSCAFINREGKVIAKYSKIHLMDALAAKESDFVLPGNEICVFETDFGKVGMMVCYDLRFPELARTMVLKGADIIFCPADFPAGNPLPPRTDHWDTLVQSTALINLTYVCAVNQFGPLLHDNPFGRSMVVDPWGTAVASAPGKQSIVYATLDMEYQKALRTRVATWENRRPDVYDLAKKWR